MTGYTVVNLKEIEDLAPKFGLSPDLESHFARRALGLENAGLSYFRIAAGVRVPFGHRHETQEEVYLILSGSGRLKLDDDIVRLGPWDAVRVSPETMRNLEAGPEGLEILAFSACHPDNTDTTPVWGWWSD